MITKLYRCDLCRNEVKMQPGAGEVGGVRLKWSTSKIFEFVDLCHSGGASEIIVCGDCLVALKEPLAKFWGRP